MTDKSQTTKLGPAAQKIADGLNDAIDGRYHTTGGYWPISSEPVVPLTTQHPVKMTTIETAQTTALTVCHAASDGECANPRCPQILDGYCDKHGNPIGPPGRKHRTCPLPWRRDDE